MLWQNNYKQTMKTIVFATLFACIFTLPVNVFAWGPTGHRVVGQIAENHLTPKAKKAVLELLGNESLAAVSIWMDEIRSDTAYDQYKDWHWVTIPEGEAYAATKKNPNGDVVAAIHQLTEVLKNNASSRADKVFALKGLVHFVGDIHQPLHVGKPGDHGGNKVSVTWFKEETNLHRVWDTHLIDHYGMSYTELANNLERTFTKEQEKAWCSAKAEDWAQESVGYRKALYEVGNGNLGYVYHYTHFATVELRLSQAGIRLASLLNSIFG